MLELSLRPGLDEARLVISLKRDAPANVVLNNLYKHTALQTSFGVNMVALVDGIPRTLNLAQALHAYVEHQIDVITRRSEHRLKKARERRIWLALCRQTRQVVAYVVGGRSERTCRRLWAAIPAAFRRAQCYTDFRAASANVLPREQHSAVGKE